MAAVSAIRIFNNPAVLPFKLKKLLPKFLFSGAVGIQPLYYNIRVL